MVQSTLGPAANPAFRQQVLNDPGNVQQFACVFGDTLGFFTRPAIVPVPGGNGEGVAVVGSFTDTIGEAFICSTTLEEFQGNFTTLVRREDAATYSLATHPVEPDTVEGRAVRGIAMAASLERLNFGMPDPPELGDYPVIVALPCFLPVGPGLTFPHLLATTDPRSFRDSFPLFEVWRQGLNYANANNDGRSVTQGGTLFNPATLVTPEGQPDPYGDLELVIRLPHEITPVLPTSPLYTPARTRLLAWSNTVWGELGAAMDAEPVPAAAVGGFTPEHFRAAMEPLVPKEKTFTSAGRTTSRYRLLLAASPPAPVGDGAAHQVQAILPELREEFVAYLSVASSATAGDDLKELIRSRLSIANGSLTSIDKDVTLEPDNITLAFSDRLRTFTWLSEKLICTSPAGAKATLGLLQLLTPDRDALAIVAEGDQEATTLLMSNSTSSTAQLDASKSSKLYCSGRLTTFRHSYEAMCNFRCLISAMVEDLDAPVVLQKLLEYSSLLVDRQGRLFFESYKHSPHLAIHPWQDLQTILSAFCRVACDSLLYKAVTRGDPVAMSNYRSAMDVSDALISDLRAILNGNGLGKFDGVPSCATWFGRVPPAGQRALPGSAGSDTKRQKTTGTDGGERTKKVADSADFERRKTMGLLQFDPAVAGTSKLPIINVYHKKRNAKNPERLCIKFLTRGHYCDRPDCKLHHVTNVDMLAAPDKTKLVEFVRKTVGLSWAEGKAPAGTV